MVLADGTIIDTDGYHALSNLYLDLQGHSFPSIKRHPKRRDALKALREFDKLLQGFPFESEEHRTAWFCAALTSVRRRVLLSAPIFIFDAPVPATGKTKLAQIIGVLATGRLPAVATWTPREEENEKRLHAAFLAGDPVLLIDNVSQGSTLEGATLEAALTSPMLDVRILGESRTVKVSANVLILATGNNIAVGRETTRRVVRIRLLPDTENPELRTFAFDPVERALNSREKLVSALLTIYMAYIKAGRPAVGSHPIASFEQWSRETRDPFLWLGLPDFAGDIETAIPSDTDRDSVTEMLDAWYEQFGEDWIYAKTVASEALTDLRSAIRDVIEKDFWNSKQLAKVLAKRTGGIVGPYQIQSKTGDHRTSLWRVRRLDTQEPAAPRGE